MYDALLWEAKCPICLKTFIPAPMHRYRFGTGNNKAKLCSWACLTEAKRRKSEPIRDLQPIRCTEYENALRDERRRLELTTSEFAVRLGVSEFTVAKIEKGGGASAGTYRKILKRIGCFGLTSSADTCVICGEVIPEGRMVCPVCEEREKQKGERKDE